jgi:hypothetical protein
MMLWIRLSQHHPTGWALANPMDIGLSEIARVRTADKRNVTDLVRGAAFREGWKSRSTRRFRFRAGMTYAQILNFYEL